MGGVVVLGGDGEDPAAVLVDARATRTPRRALCDCRARHGRERNCTGKMLGIALAMNIVIGAGANSTYTTNALLNLAVIENLRSGASPPARSRLRKSHFRFSAISKSAKPSAMIKRLSHAVRPTIPRIWC